MIPKYPKELLLYPHIQLHNEQNPEKFNDSDTTDIVQNDLYSSYDDSELDKNSFEDDPFSNDDDGQSIMFDIEFHKSTFLEDNHFQPSIKICFPKIIL